jgi:hypothetical protein
MWNSRRREVSRVLAHYKNVVFPPPDPNASENERIARQTVADLENGALPIDLLRIVYITAARAPIADFARGTSTAVSMCQARSAVDGVAAERFPCRLAGHE